MEKQCKKCNKWFDLSEFSYHPENKDKLTNSCRLCKNEMQRQYRIRNNNKCTKIYEKTHKGFLMRLYRNMKSRIKGVQKTKYNLYRGKKLIEREDFYRWAVDHPVFISLFENYRKNGYERKFAPSVDRINSKKGYELSNMEWVTMSENSRRGAVNKNKDKKT